MEILTPKQVRSMIIRSWPQFAGASPEVSEIAENVKRTCHELSQIYYENNPAIERQHNRLSLHVRSLISDTVWDLVIDGILRPGTKNREGYEKLNCFHMTEYGREVQKDPAGPYDPEAFLKRIDPHTDPVVREYLLESVHSFRQRCYLAAAIMLGCASEKMFLLVIDAYHDALQDPNKQTKFQESIVENRSIKVKHERFLEDDWYQNRLLLAFKKANVDPHWRERVDHALKSGVNSLRLLRNNVGHPELPKHEPEEVHHDLYHFPTMLKYLQELEAWLKANPLP